MNVMIKDKPISHNMGLMYLYFLWPLLGLLDSVCNYRNPKAKNLFWFFCAFYGLVHVYMPEGFSGGGADSVRYAIGLEKLYNSSTDWETFSNTFYNEGTTTDIYEPIVRFIVSRFTNNAHILFFVFATVFGFFYSRNIWYLLGKTTGRLGFTIGVFVISFALITPIWQINGVRMWTALQVYLYGFLPYLIDRDKSKLIWVYLSVLFHFSFFVIIALTILFRYIPKKELPFLIAFIISIFVNELDLSVVRERLLSLGLTAFEAKINTYTADYVMEKMLNAREGLSFHVIVAKNISSYVYQMLIFVAYYVLRKNRRAYSDDMFSRLFCATAMFYAFANIASLVPSGGRFISLAQMLSCVCTILILQNVQHKRLRNLYKLAAICLLSPIIFKIREGMDYWGISLLITNPITCWFFDDNIPMINYIK